MLYRFKFFLMVLVNYNNPVHVSSNDLNVGEYDEKY